MAPTSLADGPRERGESDGCWLAAYTRPRHEHTVAEYLLGRRYQVFLPTYSTWRYWSDRRKLIRLPLFSSYVFVRLEAARQREV
ncbi:MAG: transcription termination/antitermination NusG family protein, partial [Gammaproteobacteria bacterium]